MEKYDYITLDCFDQSLENVRVPFAYKQLGDDELIERYKANQDEDAFNTLLVRHWRSVCRGVKAYNQEAISAAYMRFIDCVNNFRPDNEKGASFRTFVARYCGYAVIDEYHKLYPEVAQGVKTVSLNEVIDEDDEDSSCFVDLIADPSALEPYQVIDAKNEEKVTDAVIRTIYECKILGDSEMRLIENGLKGDVDESCGSDMRNALAKIQRNPGLQRRLRALRQTA